MKTLLYSLLILTSLTGFSQEIFKVEKIGISSNDRFKDLKQIGKDIGKANMVLLNDWASADNGASYDAISRMINYLHEKKGFDVLIWGLGSFEGELMNTAFAENKLQDGLNTMYRVWRDSKSIRDLSEYIIKTSNTKSPLVMMGSSCQFHAFGKNNLVEYLVANQETLGLARLNAERKEKLDKLWTKPKRLKELSEAEFQELKNTIHELNINLPSNAQRLLQNMSWFVELEYLRAFTPQNQVVRVTEKFRAETTHQNLESMLRYDLKGKKVIFFGGNGLGLSQRYGNQLYTIGVTSQTGNVGRPGQNAKLLQPTDEGYLEHFLSQKKESYLYVKAGSELNGLKSRLSPEWAAIYDGVLFVNLAYPNK